MQENTRFEKSKLDLGLEGSVNERKLSRVSKVAKEMDVNIESCLNVEIVVSLLLTKLEVHTQIGEEDLPSNLSGKIFEEPNIVRKKVFVRTSEGEEGRVTCHHESSKKR